MMKKFFLIILIILIPNICCGESLFNPNTNRTTSLFADPSSRASQVGDIICIEINPQTQVNTSNTFKVQKDMEHKADFIPINIFGGPFTPLDISGSSSSGGSETGKKNFDFSTTISAVIQEIMPNGCFVVLAEQEILIGEKTQLIQFSGMVRPGDIEADNTIDSSKVANVSLIVQGELGEIEENRGIITRFLDWIF